MSGRLISIAATAIFAVSVPLPPPTTAGSIRSASADIAFASRRDGNWEIYVTDESGRDQRRLTRRDVEDRFRSGLRTAASSHCALRSATPGSSGLWIQTGPTRDVSRHTLS
jgi:Tol biopolymer transport system component